MTAGQINCFEKVPFLENHKSTKNDFFIWDSIFFKCIQDIKIIYFFNNFIFYFQNFAPCNFLNYGPLKGYVRSISPWFLQR